MNYSKKLFEEREAIRLENTIDSFFCDFQGGRLLNGAGIRKLRGTSPLKIFGTIFRLPFEGNNFFRGIAKNQALEFGKDAAYTLLRTPRHNWRKLMLNLAVKIATVFSLLTDDEREKVLIFDSSTYDRSRSKKVELLAWQPTMPSGSRRPAGSLTMSRSRIKTAVAKRLSPWRRTRLSAIKSGPARNGQTAG